jgi:hypothetical protein
MAMLFCRPAGMRLGIESDLGRPLCWLERRLPDLDEDVRRKSQECERLRVFGMDR